MQTMVMICVYVPQVFACLFFFSLIFSFFLRFVSDSRCAGHRGSKTISIYWAWYVGRFPVSYLEEFHVTYEGRLIDPKNMENSINAWHFLFTGVHGSEYFQYGIASVIRPSLSVDIATKRWTSVCIPLVTYSLSLCNFIVSVFILRTALTPFS